MTASGPTADLTALEQDVLASISKAGDLAALEGARVAAIGKKGRISAEMQKLGAMKPDDRKAFDKRSMPLRPA